MQFFPWSDLVRNKFRPFERKKTIKEKEQIKRNAKKTTLSTYAYFLSAKLYKIPTLAK